MSSRWGNEEVARATAAAETALSSPDAWAKDHAEKALSKLDELEKKYDV